MLKRDNIRLRMKSANKTERIILQSQYKKLRNCVNKKVRLENIEFNEKRVNEAKNENEIWNILKEVSNPKSSE